MSILDKPAFRGAPVGWSTDLDRIVALPRRVLAVDDPRAAEAWTAHLRRDRLTPCDCDARWGVKNPDTGILIPGSGCIRSLKPVQGWALEEAMDASGLIASIMVGGGKTGIDILLSMAIPGVRVAVLLIPSSLRPQMLNVDYPRWSQHFKVPNLAGGGSFEPGRPVLHILSYSELSLKKNSDIFKRIGGDQGPDLIIADEMQNLSNADAARTERFLRLFKPGKIVRFAGQTGTITKTKIKDFAHLSGLALRQGSPVPLQGHIVDEWGLILDAAASYVTAPLGAFRKLMNEGEAPRDAFRRRFVETQGVVATSEAQLGISLYISERVPSKVPEAVKQALEGVVGKEERPDGDQLTEAVEIAAVGRQVSAGFYYKWAFKNGETRPQIEKWLKARKEWRQEARGFLKYRAREGMDSYSLIEDAAKRWWSGYTWRDPHGKLFTFEPKTKGGPLPIFDCEFWPAWRDIADTVHPITETVWVDTFLAEDAAAWAIAKDKGIVWYQHTAFGKKVAELSKVPFYGQGALASAEIITEKGERSIVASIKAHSVGKNLQTAFYRNLIANPPSDGAAWEQMLGRTHRQYQPRPEVFAEVYRHTVQFKDAMAEAIARARYMEQVTGSQQKLGYANYSFREE